jgi:PhnB protein
MAFRGLYKEEMMSETQGPYYGVVPMLMCRDAAAEMEFCKAAFGAVELSRRTAEDGSVLHGLVAIGAALVMVHGETHHFASRAPQPDGSSSVVIYLYLNDVDAAMTKAVAAGACIVLAAEDQFWGDRVGRIIDPESHVWNIASRVKSV